MCLYAQFLSRSFKAVGSIRNYVAAVRLLHKLLEYTAVSCDAIELRLTLQGIARLSRHLARQAAPMTPELLLAMSERLDLSKPFDATIWCLFLFPFFAMARKSNLVPADKNSFDKDKQLVRGRVLEGKGCLLLFWSWAKNIQFGNRVHKIPLLEIPGSKLCPVWAFRNMCTLVPVPQQHPAFCLHSKGNIVPITYPQFNSALKALIKKVGKDPQEFSSHSFRRGGATCAFKAEVPDTLIQLHGDWASDCYKRYLHMGLEEKKGVSQKIGRLVAQVTSQQVNSQ